MPRARLLVLTVAGALVAAGVTWYAVAGHSGGRAGSSLGFQAPGLPGGPGPAHGPAIPASGAYFGAWVRQGAYTQTAQVVALDTLQGVLGRRLDIVHSYLKWQAPFPTLTDQVALRQGSTLLLSWTGTNSQAVLSGTQDGAIRQLAQEIKGIRKPIFLEWRWEMDRPNLRGTVGPPGEFVAAWKHVRAIFTAAHVSNVAWVWCPTARGFAAGGDAPAYYPGDGQVDWICVDAYPGAGPYRSFSQVAQPFLSWASHHRKPVMIGEFGVQRSYGPAQRAQWLEAAAQTVRSDPQIKALVYFDSDPAGASLANGMALDYGTAPMQAFRRIAASPYFNPRRLAVKG